MRASPHFLARTLQRQSRDDVLVTVFEGEASPNFRSHGGTLYLHEETGQHALRTGGPYDESLKYARLDGEAMKLCDKNLLCYINMGGGKLGSSTGRVLSVTPRITPSTLLTAARNLGATSCCQSRWRLVESKTAC